MAALPMVEPGEHATELHGEPAIVEGGDRQGFTARPGKGGGVGNQRFGGDPHRLGQQRRGPAGGNGADLRLERGQLQPKRLMRLGLAAAGGAGSMGHCFAYPFWPTG